MEKIDKLFSFLQILGVKNFEDFILKKKRTRLEFDLNTKAKNNLDKNCVALRVKKCRSRISLRSETIMLSSSLSLWSSYKTLILMTATKKKIPN